MLSLCIEDGIFLLGWDSNTAGGLVVALGIGGIG